MPQNPDGSPSPVNPDLPGCIATGKTGEGVMKRMAEAIKLHLEGMRQDNIPVPSSRSSAEYISLDT
ncbi:MAG: type II toxin-antitoxin system HicB family antitoxin [Deltaproteobacteria bacterium]|nr:type II toxin-antitoxin system HicB family antitoxin [Deltaproteobacteria bacterium]